MMKQLKLNVTEWLDYFNTSIDLYKSVKLNNDNTTIQFSSKRKPDFQFNESNDLELKPQRVDVTVKYDENISTTTILSCDVDWDFDLTLPYKFFYNMLVENVADKLSLITDESSEKVLIQQYQDREDLILEEEYDILTGKTEKWPFGKKGFTMLTKITFIKIDDYIISGGDQYPVINEFYLDNEKVIKVKECWISYDSMQVRLNKKTIQLVGIDAFIDWRNYEDIPIRRYYFRTADAFLKEQETRE